MAHRWSRRLLDRGDKPVASFALFALLLGTFSGFPSSPASAATAGSGSCAQTVSDATRVAVTSSGSDCIITFSGTRTNADNSVEWTVPTGVTTVDLLVVGGGGSGGHDEGGGGGAGLFIEKSDYTLSGDISAGKIAVQVGAGGTFGSVTSGTGDNGGNSRFGSIVATGGGKGGDANQSDPSGYDGHNGGSGGGGAGEFVGSTHYRGDPGLARNNADSVPDNANGEYGSSGGDGWSESAGGAGGGGGGAGGAGANATTGQAGNGGAGKASSITGSSVTYAAGGGGGRGNTSTSGNGSGGSSIGGNGGDDNTLPTQGQDGTGSGGGGGGDDGSAFAGGAGGDGIVIVRYTIAATPTVGTSPSNEAVNATQTATFSASATSSDGGTISYQWQSSTNSGSSWSDIAGATSSSYTTSAVTATSSGYQYRAVARNTLNGNYSEATSSVATLTVSRISQTVTWSPPSAQTSLVLADSGLTINAATTSGDGALTYSVNDAGSTGCSIDGSRVVTFSGAGTCVLSVAAAQTDTYSAASATVSLVIARGTFAITSPGLRVGVTDSSFTDVCTSTCDLTGFATADEILVIVSKSDGTALSGRVRLGSTTGLVQSQTGYQTDASAANGHAEIAFVGTQAEVNAALETLQYKGPAGGGDESLGITASLSGAAYFAGTGSFYEVINVGSVIAWEDARCRALYGNSSAHDNSAGLTQTNDECTNKTSRRTLNGLNGYLANITSLEEHNFLRSKLNDVGWIGGADLDTEGTFQWMDGPEAGQVFFVSGTSTRRTTNSIGGVSRFNYFSDGEPNNSGGAEDFVEFGFGSNGVGSSWNDCQNSCNRTRFVIEYGGDGGTVLKQASTTFDVGAPTAPLQVSGGYATAGNLQLVLSWSAPDTGGSAITDYVIEQFDAGSSTWSVLADGVSTATTYTVTGLTNGTSYSFRVSAKNIVGTGTASGSFSGTPAAPAPSGGGSGGSSGGVTPTPAVVPLSPGAPRVIVPSQPTPAPRVLQAPVITPGRVFDPNIGSRATVGGAPATVAQRALPSGGISVQAGALQFGLSLAPGSGGGVDTNTSSNTPELRVPTGQSTAFNGGGLLPGSQVQVWLPGRTGNQTKELARVPVRADGTFEAALSFAVRQTDVPVPIGRQVMQVTGFDENGNQTVVDMTINVAQGPLAPEPERQSGQVPQLTPGLSLATSAGAPAPVTITRLPDQNAVAIGDGSWVMTVGVDGAQGTIEGPSEAPVVRMTQSSQASASGEGFMAGTTASVWMFSDPTLMATVTVGEDGSFTADFFVDPQFLPAGNHTLQIQGVGNDGFIKAANLGVEVQEPVELTTQSATGLLWWVAGALLMLLAVFLLLVAARRRSRRAAN